MIGGGICPENPSDQFYNSEMRYSVRGHDRRANQGSLTFLLRCECPGRNRSVIPAEVEGPAVLPTDHSPVPCWADAVCPWVSANAWSMI